MKTYKQLKKGQIEITWIKGNAEIIQTQGMVFQAGSLVLDLGTSKLIVPLTSVKHFRVLAIG
jgi:hypothetical protein